MRRPAVVAFLFLLFALPASAQSVVVGSQYQIPAVFYILSPPWTIVDIAHPATANGNVTLTSFYWGGGGCTGALKIKFLRPAAADSLGAFTLVAERGPFTAVTGRNRAPLTPPVAVQQGDLLAITMLAPFESCGSVMTAYETGSAVMQLTGDVSSGTLNGKYFRDNTVAARAVDTNEVLEGVIPAVGSLQGAFGAFFRTSLQVGCPGGGQCSGKFVFHPAGVPFSPNDQALPYTVTGTTATSYTDIVATMGKSGLGTLDVISTDGFPPLVTARVYNDTGATGTSGFTEDMIPTLNMLHSGDHGIILTPADLTNYRMNIGVRTLSSTARVVIQIGSRTQNTLDFPANTFKQYTLAELGDPSPIANEQIHFFVLGGDLAIYGSTTDNRTNDSSAKILRRE